MRPLARPVLAVVSVVLLLSMGGGFLVVPALAPLHVWAARSSSTNLGRVLWSLPPVASSGMAAWALVYVMAGGEAQPWIWLVPVATVVAAALALARVTARRP